MDAARELVARSRESTRLLFQNSRFSIPPENEKVRSLLQSVKYSSEYNVETDEVPGRSTAGQEPPVKQSRGVESTVRVLPRHPYPSGPGVRDSVPASEPSAESVKATVEALPPSREAREAAKVALIPAQQQRSVVRIGRTSKAPKWHAPWRMMRVISGHLGWVRSVAVDASNDWFATGSADRTIKIWDMASGDLKLTLTGHISAVRGLAISDSRPYLFSVGEDKMAKCWDLEVNRVVRHYHGHLSGIYCCTLHPTIDVFFTGGRDSTARVWDIRTKTAIHVLTGHSNTVATIASQSLEPQMITGSHDSTIRLWDLAAGKTRTTLTHHKKGIRSIVTHHSEYTFLSGATDNLKKWKCPNGDFMHNFSGHRAVINTVAVNQDNVFFSGGDNGSMCFWDYETGHLFQDTRTTVQPGSIESEAGILASCFDRTGSRLITCEADKSIKFWKEDENATPETHPTKWSATSL